MKEEFENYVYEQIKANLDDELSAILIRGHTKEERKIPYIYVDISEWKSLENMHWQDGIYEVVLNIAIADSAYSIDYTKQAEIRRKVESAVENIVLQSDNFLINYISLEEISDARDDNNIGEILNYSIIVQS